MSAEPKLKGTTGNLPEITKLKRLWRDSMSESARDYYRALFISETTQAEILKIISARLRINLPAVNYLNDFRDWLKKEDARDKEAEAQLEDERRLKEQFGDSMTKDQIREKVLSASYARTIATGDFKLGLATVREDRGLMEAGTAREKFLLDSDAFFDSMLKKAAELNASTLSNAGKISAMRKAAFQSVDELQASGRVKIPKA